MPAPATAAELHIDRALSNIVVNRRPEGFIADQLLPITPVAKQTDIYWKFVHRENFQFKQGLTRRAPGTEAKKVYMSVASDTYRAENYALGTDWPVEDEVNADEILMWRESNANMLTDRLNMDYEMRVAELATNTSNVGTVTTVASAWSDPEVAKAFTDIMNLKEDFRLLTGRVPNTAIVPAAVWQKLKLNEEIRGRVFGSNNGGVVTREQFASLIEIPRLLIPMAQVNTVGEFETAQGNGTLSDVWGSHFWVADINLLQGRQTDTWLNAFRWTSPLFDTPFAVQAYPYDPKKKRYDLEVGYYQTEKVVSEDLAIRIGDVLG